MGTTTTRLALYKPAATGENIDVTSNLNANLDKLDAMTGAIACTSGTRPGAPYNGQFIRETDTGNMMLWDGSAWKQILYSTSTFANSLNVTGSASFTSQATVTRGATTDDGFRSRVTGDTQNRWVALIDGKQFWGPGGSTATDTNLYRSAVGTLKTDNALIVAGALTANGVAALGSDLSVAGVFSLNGATYDNQLSNFTQLTNTVTETVIGTFTIPANTTAVGAVYRIRCWGNLSVTGTPTMTFKSNLSGSGVLTVPAITVRSGATDGNWDLEFLVSTKSLGVSGTWGQCLTARHNFVTSATTYTLVGPQVGANVTRDTTASVSLNLTATWSAASASNVLNVQGVICERVA